MAGAPNCLPALHHNIPTHQIGGKKPMKNAENNRPIRGMRIRTLNFGMIIVSFILYILLLFASFNALHKYNVMVAATDEYIASEKDALLLAAGSNYLTEQMRLFCINMDLKHVDNYFTEVYTTKRRDRVLELAESYDKQDRYKYLKDALDRSNILMDREIYSMKLIATAQRYDMSEYKDIEDVKLTAEDAALSPEEMTAKARDIAFGEEYQEYKKTILDNISNFMDHIIHQTQTRQADSTADLKQTIKNQRILTSVLFIETILVFILIIRLIVKPLQIYIKNIKDEKRLDITGSYEFKYLALTYNNIFELNAANEAMLRHQAEHDPLTGIINRGAFDQLKEFFKTKAEPIALLIIDVDKFKLINDGYGHEMGDRVLKRVAKLLTDDFRSADFPARIGGDEFAVIMTHITADMKPMVKHKIDCLNEKLLHPDDDLPKVSLSVGAAFSEYGFTDDLYSQADAALYDVKEHGRCGCRFYEGQGQN